MQVEVSPDDYAIIQVVKDTMNCNEEKAVTILIEIGLNNILSYPTGIKRIDSVLNMPDGQKMVKKLKSIWKL